jgi:hypothetical protein
MKLPSPNKFVKNFFYHTVAWSPLLILFIGTWFFTNLPQSVYTDSIRNIYFDCLEFVPESYVYKAKPGPCKFNNVEFDTVLNHSAEGFRNPDGVHSYDVATLGDSMAHGWGVQDDETFSSVLGSKHHYPTKNLAIASYATMRELEVFLKHGQQIKYVVLQYCDNDYGENVASLNLDTKDFYADVEKFWRTYIVRYNEGKAMGYQRPLFDLAQKVRNLSFMWKANWRRAVDQRDMDKEASTFAQIVERYRSILEGKRLILFEGTPWGLNSPKFQAAFTKELNRLGWLAYRIIDTSKLLDYSDNYFLDGHLKAIGHSKLAAAIALEIDRWEIADPTLDVARPK